MLSFQQFWTRPSVCICRQIVWTFGAYGLVALIFISGEDVVRHTFASWIFFYCLLLFLILFLLFIVLKGAVCYPLELRLTRIGLIWHQASVSISWNQHPRHLLDARVRTCRRCPPDLSRSHSQQPARVQGRIPMHNCGNGINETTSGSAFIRNQSVTVRTVNWCHQRSTPGCTCQEKLRYMKLRQPNCWYGLWRQICTTDDGFFEPSA